MLLLLFCSPCSITLQLKIFTSVSLVSEVLNSAERGVRERKSH